ncbi:MAG: hypothetical protein IPN34_25965 [Planctomycetes bacterium]|nr:hypothetical protein [Planctomycetota bacterium]
MTKNRFQDLEDAHACIHLAIQCELGVSLSTAEWARMRTPRELLDELERRGVLRGEAPAPKREELEAEVRSALVAALGTRAEAIDRTASLRTLFADDRASWERLHEPLRLEPVLELSRWIRLSATVLPAAVLLAFLGERLSHGAEGAQIPIYPAFVGAALAALLSLWIVTRKWAHRAIPEATLDALVDRCVRRELGDPRHGFSRARALAWLQIVVEGCRSSKARSSAVATPIREDQSFLEALEA